MKDEQEIKGAFIQIKGLIEEIKHEQKEEQRKEPIVIGSAFMGKEKPREELIKDLQNHKNCA